MKKNKPKYLKYYREWMKAGRMPYEGLCSTLFDDLSKGFSEFYTIFPTSKDLSRLKKKGLSWIYWGSDSGDWQEFVFTPLRQNLVLLMAALNNEL